MPPTMIRSLRRIGLFRASCALTFLFALLPSGVAHAAAALSAEIVSWQIVGLDSNQPASGTPEIFMVQAKVTNTGDATATNTRLTLSLASPSCGASACIALASDPIYTVGSLAPGATADAFWTIKVAKTSSAIGTTTNISVTAEADNVAPVVATQQSRTPPPCGKSGTASNVLFVARLISQARNDVLSYFVSSGFLRPDGSWEVLLGSDFTVSVLASTSTKYQEISVPASIDPSGTIVPFATQFNYGLGTPSDDDIYTLNAGGDVSAIYSYRAAALGSVQVAQLIYDCSGNSFHYNSDYLKDAITIHVVGQLSGPPTAATPLMRLTKTSNPAGTVDAGEPVTFTISYQNTGFADATNFTITDQIDPLLGNITPDAGGAYDPATRTITWPIGTVPPGGSGSVSFTATIDDFAGGKTIRNTASGRSDQFTSISSGTVSLTVRPSLPVTGPASELLAILGWASIGFGISLSSRRLEMMTF